MNRLSNLDYLRGLSAFGIMVFHYLYWTNGVFSADTFLGRFGIYGVAIFYVLSGLTLFHVYYDEMQFTWKDLIAFAKKRIFRIFPLLWLVTITSIIIAGKIPGIYNLLFNFTGLFGFVRWDVYYAIGAWSIGNELVFYVFFPFFILLTKKFKPLMALLALLIFSFHLYFAFFKLDAATILNEQWRNYVNPLNQIFLFLGGFLIGYFFRKIEINKVVAILCLSAGACLLIFYPVNGDMINLLTGTNRLVFTLSIFLICLGFYKFTIQLPEVIHKPLSLLGESSYSVYLIHPVIYHTIEIVLGENFNKFPAYLVLLVSGILTLVISYFVYQYFEKYFMSLGRKKYFGFV